MKKKVWVVIKCKLSNEPNETQKQTKRIEIHQSQTITFWTRSSEHLLPRRSAKMIDVTEKSEIRSNNKNDLWWAAVAVL